MATHIAPRQDETPIEREPIALVHAVTPSSLLSLIRTVQALKDAYRPITEAERELMRGWPGWGAYTPAFELEPRAHWQAVGPQIRELLGPEGYEAASAATPTSYFTAPYISKAIWDLAERLGCTGGVVLEPGCGTGQILACAPAWPMQVTGIEQEPFSAQIAHLLLPHAQIVQAPLQKVALVDDSFDLVVGNVPFADVSVYDRTAPLKFRLHNYFLWRALTALRPGGLALLVTSRYTLDAATIKARQQLSHLGALLGAIRLPSYGHRWAKTAVVTDLLILQRRHPDGWEGHAWVELAELSCNGVQIATNGYFATHPEHILGTMSLDRGLYRENELVIKAPDDLEGALAAAVEALVQDVTDHGGCYIPRVDRTQLDSRLVTLREDGLKEGCFYLRADAGLIQIVDGQPKAVPKLVEELSDLVRLRDSALSLVQAESDYTRTDEALAPLREALNRCYDAYVEGYGPVRRSTLRRRIDKKTGEEHITRKLSPALSAFRTDEYYPLVLSLELYDDETQEAKKAAIFSQRVNYPPVYKETASSPAEALALSLDRFGRVDFPFISRATGQPEEAVAAYLGDLVYENPETQRWEIAPQYLSGNVRHKLEIAQVAVRSDARWQRNVEALSAVQPDPLAPEDIKVLLGAPWVPASHIAQFCNELLHTHTTEVARDPASGTWDVIAPTGASSSAEATSTWGTTRVSAFRLIEHLLNHRTTTVVDMDSKGKEHLNTDETMLAQQKRKELAARFSEWIWEDLERTKELAALYNKLYNGVVPSKYTGDHLSFPGMDPCWQQQLYSWQRDFIARMITSRSALCAYPVGSGKTKIQVAGAMTLRRMQLISKAAILVPDHLLEQITAEAKQLYPHANVLMISRHDLARENRRIFMARIATGDHDLVVMTHSAFEAIDVHPETKRVYMRERIRDYRQVLLSIEKTSETNADRRRVKRLEKQLQRMQARLDELMDTQHDAGITFEQLGISYLLVDEAHFFKNLGLPTNQEKLQVTPSQRAQDMLMKLRWLEKRNPDRPFASFFTATPISNSMVEAFVMLWYLARGLLADYELSNVDDFASMFIQTEAKIEVTPNGAGFRLYERPSCFVNLPEFQHLFGAVADIRPPDILAENRPDRLEHTISVEPTPEVVAYVNWLVERSALLDAGRPMAMGEGKEDNWLWVTTDGRMAALWLGLHGRKEEYPAKLDAIATEMAKVYHRWQEKASYLPGPYKSLQIGFCDLGTPQQDKGDQVYGMLKHLLVQQGVPAGGIRFVHEAKSDAAKAALFEQCRTGEVAILLGSTAKLGTGTNIQTRCAAIHHCDAPWRPDEVEQREGRGQRPGNLYPVVEIFYYVQKRTFDAYSWQILANKARFYNQLRSATTMSREIAYSDDSTLTYGQVKAAATGDILLQEHANVSLAVESFSRLRASFQRARDRDRQEAQFLQAAIARIEATLARYEEIAQCITAFAGDSPYKTADHIVLEKRETWRDYIHQQVLAAVQQQTTTVRHLGTWKDVPISFQVDVVAATPYVFIVGDPERGFQVPCYAAWLEEANSWRFAWKIEQFFQGLPSTIEEQRQELLSKRQRAQEFEHQASSVFPQQEAWQAALSRKEALDRYIACAASAASDEALRTLAEMRQRLLETMPQELVERPRPKSVATFVLPPRHPEPASTPATASPQSGEQIAVQATAPEEPTIEQVAREIQRHVQNDPWAEPIVASAAEDAWAALRQQYGTGKRRSRRK